MARMLVIVALVAVSGCTRLIDSGLVAPPTQPKEILKVEESDAVNVVDLLGDMQVSVTRRNTQTMRLVGMSDMSCGKFVAHLYGRRAVTNVWYSNLTSATAAAAAIVGGRAAQNLAGVSAVSNQARTSINSEIYGGELIPNVASEIAKLRKAQRKVIVDGAQKTLGQYPAEQALSDVIEYHELCSIPIAMSSLLRKANAAPAPTLNVSSVLASIDDAIEKEKALLTSMGDDTTAEEKTSSRKRILGLIEQRSLIVRMYAVPMPTAGAAEEPEPAEVPDIPEAPAAPEDPAEETPAVVEEPPQ